MAASPRGTVADRSLSDFDRALAAAERLPFADQARLITALLPMVLLAIEAAHQGTPGPTAGGTPDSRRALLAAWGTGPQDDDPKWDGILHALGVELAPEGR